MKENKILSIIESIIGSKYIGDDCAYLEDLGIVVTQDSLVENIHFDMNFITPFQLGYKSAMVNISDVCASGAEPKYITVALSLPSDISETFVEEFYKGCKNALNNVEIIGGDITGGKEICISITAIGTTKDRKISSRSNAQIGQYVIVSGVHGSSSCGLELLQQGKKEPQKIIDNHLMPKAQIEFSKQIAKSIDVDYAMMDTSDGLADALFKIATSSKKTLNIDFDKIIFDKEILQTNPNNYIEKILYGGEDYQIVATVPQSLLNKLENYTIIGQVIESNEQKPVILNFKDKTVVIDNLEKSFNHFGKVNKG